MQTSKSSTRLLAIVACSALLLGFGAMSFLAGLRESPTFDEPLHLASAYVQTYAGDFRDNPEDPPLWKYFAAAFSNASWLKIDRGSEGWKRMLATTAAGNRFSLDTLFAGTRGGIAENVGDGGGRPAGVFTQGIFTAARARMVLGGMMLGGLIAWWAWRAAEKLAASGLLAAVIATAVYSFDPNFLAHSGLVKNDVPITLMLLAVMAMVWLVGERATVWRIVLLGVLTGAGIATKFSGVLGIPMIGLALFGRAMSGRPWMVIGIKQTGRVARAGAAVAIGAAAMAVAFGFIWMVYGFRFSPGANPAELFDLTDTIRLTAVNETLRAHGAMPYTPTETLLGWMKDWRPGAQTRLVLWADAHHVLPQAFLLGFQYTYAESLARGTFLCGDISLVGWWYYFPLVILFKTPTATLAGLLIALAASWRLILRPGGKGAGFKRDIWPIVALVIPPAFYMIFAMANHLNLGVRHVLPVYPYLFIFLGVMSARTIAWRREISPSPGASEEEENARTRVHLSKFGLTIAAICMTGLMVESLLAYPDFLPFFNVAARLSAPAGRAGGENLLSDSNLDWGQGLLQLADWQKKHPDRPLYLCYFGTVDPAEYGIVYHNLPESMAAEHPLTAAQAARETGPPVYAISISKLQGVYLSEARLHAYDRLRNQAPDEIVDGSIYIFDSAHGMGR